MPLWGVGLLLVSAFILLVVSAVLLFNTVRGLAADIQVTAPDLSGLETGSGTAETTRQPQPGGSDNGGGAVNLTPTPSNLIGLDGIQRWPGKERLNVLLMGIDVRCNEEGPTRTDSMMVVSLDPVGLSISALSLPRDLWVEVPGFGMDSINDAHFLGQANQYPGGGPGLALDTVENFLGVKVDHYVTVNFEGFRDFINLIDGIQVQVSEAIYDPNYPDECYGYDPFRIEAGLQSMNGPIALKYARTRATANGDIDRAARQQQVLLAARNKVLDVNMIPQLIARLPQLWQTFQRNAKTSFTDREVIQLALLVQEIPRDRVTTGVIDYRYVYNETAPNGRQVLVPRIDEIRKLRAELFPPVAAPTPVVENLEALASGEAARVVVLNGTATVGLASATAEYLKSRNINVVEIGNADSAAYQTTRIVDYGRHPFTVRYLLDLMGLPPLNAGQSTVPQNYDVLVIIGADWRVPTP